MDRKRSVRSRSRNRRPFAKKCKDLCRNFVAFMFSNVGIIGLVISYTVSGAVIFRTIERTHGVNPLVVRVNMTRNATALNIWNVTLRSNPIDERRYRFAVDLELLRFQEKIVWYHRNESYLGLKEGSAEKWTFARAFLYSLTVITTIGYGNIFPSTYEGKIATIVYAIIGMPLFLLYLSNIGDIMARSFKWVYANCCLCRWCPRVAKRREERKRKRAQMRGESDDDDDQDDEDEETPEIRIDSAANYRSRPSIVSDTTSEMATEANTEEDDEESYDIQTVTVPVTICLAIMVGYICGGALLFCTWENWEFLDASYFCFISLSTIGFGDLVPGENIYGHRTQRQDDASGSAENLVREMLELKFVFCSLYLMLGMALIAMCFNLMQEEVIHKIRTTVRTIKYILRCHR